MNINIYHVLIPGLQFNTININNINTININIFNENIC